MNGITLTTVSRNGKLLPAISSTELAALLNKKRHSHLVGTIHKVRKALDGRGTRYHFFLKKIHNIPTYILTEEGVGYVFDWLAKTHKKTDYQALRDSIATAFALAKKNEVAPVLPMEPEAAAHVDSAEPEHEIEVPETERASDALCGIEENLDGLRGAIVVAVRDAMSNFFATHQIDLAITLSGKELQRIPLQ